MERTVRVDVNDHAPCDQRCSCSDGVYCAGYPRCAVGALHKLQNWLESGRPERRFVPIATCRSGQGGYSTNRLYEDRASGATVEEVELMCRTLKFEALQTKAHDDSAQPAGERAKRSA